MFAPPDCCAPALDRCERPSFRDGVQCSQDLRRLGSWTDRRADWHSQKEAKRNRRLIGPGSLPGFGPEVLR